MNLNSNLVNIKNNPIKNIMQPVIIALQSSIQLLLKMMIIEVLFYTIYDRMYTTQRKNWGLVL